MGNKGTLPGGIKKVSMKGTIANGTERAIKKGAFKKIRKIVSS